MVRKLLTALLSTFVAGQKKDECESISAEYWVDISGGEKAFKEAGIGSSWGTEDIWKVDTTRMYDNAYMLKKFNPVLTRWEADPTQPSGVRWDLAVD